MKTLEELRAIYQHAKALAVLEENDRAKEVSRDLRIMAEHFCEIYDLQTTILKRAKCKGMSDSFEAMAEIIDRFSLTDKRVRAFFGIITSSADAPSYHDIMDGNARIEKPAELVPSDEDAWFGAYKAPTPPPAPASEGSAPVPEEWVFVPSDESGIPDGEGNAPEDEVSENETGEPMPEDNASGSKIGPSFAPESLDDFIGQTHVVKRIKAEIDAAKKQGLHHIDHILLFGNRGLGKSTLMKLIAKELGVRFEFMDASQFGNDVRSQRAVQKFFQRISRSEEPVVIAFDEIHALPKHIQTGLLTLLNDRVYSYLDDSGQTHNIPITDFTFIGATTDAQDVLSTIKDRCNNLTFYLKDYTRDELHRIFVNKFAAKGLRADETVLFECINRCRSSIREVDAFVNGLKTKAVNAGTNDVTLDMVLEYFHDTDRDPIGLKAKDLEILGAIYDDPTGVMSEDTLAARVHLDNKVLTKEFEPYLLKIGFISINSRGRSLTQRALDYFRKGYYEFAAGIAVGKKEVPATENGEPMSEGNPSENSVPPTDAGNMDGREA